MKRLLERTFVVGAAAERAWAELVAAEQWPKWARHLRSVQVTPPGPVGPGSRATLHLTNHTRATVRVTEFQDRRRFRWEGSFLWLGLGYDHLVTTDEAGQVRVTFTVDAAGVGATHDRTTLRQDLRPQSGPRHPPTAGPAASTRPGTPPVVGWFSMAGMRGSPTPCRHRPGPGGCGCGPGLKATRRTQVSGWS